MSPETLKALKESESKWRRYSEGEDIEVGNAESCPLCALFNNKGYSRFVMTDDRCDGCPVAEVGERFCSGTPYDE